MPTPILPELLIKVSKHRPGFVLGGQQHSGVHSGCRVMTKPRVCSGLHAALATVCFLKRWPKAESHAAHQTGGRTSNGVLSPLDCETRQQKRNEAGVQKTRRISRRHVVILQTLSKGALRHIMAKPAERSTDSLFVLGRPVPVLDGSSATRIMVALPFLQASGLVLIDPLRNAAQSGIP